MKTKLHNLLCKFYECDGNEAFVLNKRRHYPKFIFDHKYKIAFLSYIAGGLNPYSLFDKHNKKEDFEYLTWSWKEMTNEDENT